MVDKRATKASGRSVLTPTNANMHPEVSLESSPLTLGNPEGESHHTSGQHNLNNHSAIPGVAENRDSPDLIDEEFLELLCKAPDISAEQQEQALNSGAIPTVTLTDVEKELISKKIKEAQIAGDDILESLCGDVSSHQDVGFVPFFDENIKELKAPLPLTIFEREWQKGALKYHIQFKGSESTDKTYKGLLWLSEWTQTRSKWTKNHRAFHLTLRDVYNKVIFAAKLLKHKENCDAIGDQYGFMTAFSSYKLRNQVVRETRRRGRLTLDDQPRYGETSPTGQVTISQCQNWRRQYGVRTDHT
ncbi:hypothetical protein PSTT_12443 [Puccinia striiformis]|uniref:Uncharacterized protein n=1 Tax=Puccinia striiformis TaxID=27350 RepID=A0A2S4UWE3_9BASI|nr:hypothetical protein PSTT_12443 [Puccinia striiformis]